MILKNKITLITGATGVIGEAIAEKFVQEGAKIFLIGRSDKRLKKIQKKLDSNVIGSYIFDVSKLENYPNLVKEFSRVSDGLDILVNVTGTIGEISPLEESDPKEWKKAIETNLFGTAWMSHYFIPFLKKNKNSKIINFAGGGECPIVNQTSYTSSKGAILRFTESLAAELENNGIDVNAISPGLINSGFVREIIKAGPKKAGKQKYKESIDQVENKTDVVTPERAAGLAVYLASAKSNGVTGKNFSATWDKWENMADHRDEIMSSDIYNMRRIKPKDRGYDWK